MKTPTLTTERMVLACHTQEDLEELAALWAEPGVYAMIGGQPRSREEVWLRLLRAIGQWQVFGYGSWLVRARDDGRLLGEVGLLDARRSIEPAIDDAPEFGIAFATAAHGKGFASEALGAALDWVDAHGLRKTRCIIEPANTASIRLAERAGFRFWANSRYRDRPVVVLERSVESCVRG